MIADPDAMLASPLYLEEHLRTVNKQEDESSSQGVSKTGVAFIAVICTLVVVAATLVAFVVSVKTSKLPHTEILNELKEI